MLVLQQSPLQIEGYYVREFTFAVRPGFEEEPLAMQTGLHMQEVNLFNPDPITINMLTGGGRNPNDPLRWVSIVEIKSQMEPERRFPYDFRVVLVGFFRIDPPPEGATVTEEIERVIKINSTSILYSAAREFIAGVTGRGPLPGVVLPSAVVRYDETIKDQLPLAKKSQSKRKRAAKKQPKRGARKKTAK
jgi:preprotein translocase subunit SecB